LFHQIFLKSCCHKHINTKNSNDGFPEIANWHSKRNAGLPGNGRNINFNHTREEAFAIPAGAGEIRNLQMLCRFYCQKGTGT